jgi:hypothetical protein
MAGGRGERRPDRLRAVWHAWTVITAFGGVVDKIVNRPISTQCPKFPLAHPTRN